MKQRPNLDLIQLVQRARMLHDASVQPSQVSAVYWIEARSQAEHQPAPTTRAGYWVVSTTGEAADALWAVVRQATENGQLGYKSKVSTAPGPGQLDPKARVIHVRTYDSTDQVDVERVRTALIQLGIQPQRYEAGPAHPHHQQDRPT